MFTIKADNFLSFEHVEFDFSNRGLVLITGENRDQPLEKSNGAGKTNLVGALTWGIYGKLHKIASPDKVVFNKVGRDCVVDVAWGEYRVVRYRKHTKYKNDLQFFHKDISLTAKSNKDTQDLIDKTIGLSYESFIHSIYFQQNILTTFATASDSEQKAIIEDILNLRVLSVAQEIAKEQVKEFLLKINEQMLKLREMELLKKDSEERITNLESKSQNFEQTRTFEHNEAKEKLAVLKSRKNNNTSDFDIDEARSIVVLTEPFAEEIKALEDQMLECNARKKQHEKSEQEALLQVKIAKSQIATLQSGLQRMKRDDGKCPTCGQFVAKKFSEDQIADLLQQIADQEAIVLELEDNHKLICSSNSIETEVLDIQQTVREKKELLDMAAKLRQRIMSEEYRLKEIQMLDSNITDVENRIFLILKRENPYKQQFQEEVKKNQSAIESITNTLLLADALKTESSYFEYWVDGLANNKLKSYIMDSITPILNERANYYSQMLTAGAYEIEISTVTKLKSGELRDKFSVNVRSTDNTDYEQCSGGQRKRIDVCILLALQDVVASRSKEPLKLLIMDEISENLDEIGVERMLELLLKIADNKGSCFYITHDESMKPLFPNSVLVIKENHVSTLSR